MAIELRPYTQAVKGSHEAGDIDEVVAEGVYVHLEVLSHDAVMLSIHEDDHFVMLRITHKGQSPLRIRQVE